MASTNDMTQGKILPVLIKFTIPIFLGDMFQQFYNIVDTIIVGRTLGTNALAAVGSTGTLMFLIVGLCTTLANGFAVVTAQKFGAKNEDGVHVSFTNGLIMIVLITALITLLSLVSIKQLLVWMNTPEDIFNDAMIYISVIIEGLIITSFYNYFAANLRAIGNSKVPLYFLVLASFINIVLDIFFIVVLGMGTDGAAKATIASQFISAIGCLFYILKKEPILRPSKSDWHFDKVICLKQLEIGVPMAIQNSITASGTVIMQSATNIFGSTVVASNVAASKVRMLFSQPFISLGQSIATYCGQNFGCGNMKRVKEGVKVSAEAVIVYSIIAAILCNVLLVPGMKLFVTDISSLDALLPWARTYMHITTMFLIPLGFIFVYRSALQSCGHSVFAMTAGMIEFVSRLICASLAIHTKNYIMAIMCDCAAWVTAGIFLIVSFYIFDKKNRF